MDHRQGAGQPLDKFLVVHPHGQQRPDEESGPVRVHKIRPRIHAYARSKGQHLSAAVFLLQSFVEQVWSFRVSEEQTPAVEPSPAPQRDDGWQALDLR